jgi:carboxypeptidase Taq
LFGYFPTYALGNHYFRPDLGKLNQAIPNLEEQIEQGKYEEMLAWLRTNLHRHGAKFEPQVIVKRVTGTGITPEPYMRYLTQKFTDIYGL